MLQVALRRGGFVAALAIGILFILPAAGFTHSGGTDEYGCHAGSQPYHCHGGGSGGGSGGGGGSTAPPADPGPSASEQAKITKARAELASAEASYAESKRKASKLDKRLTSAEDKVDEQQSGIQDLQDEADRGQQEATSLRAVWIEDREDAAQRIDDVRTDNREAFSAYDEGRLAGVFVAGLLAAFLLLRVAKWVAALILGGWWRIATVVLGLLGSFVFLGLSASLGPFTLEAVAIALGGLMLGFVLMLARIWLIAATMPPKLALALIGTAAIVAAIFFATAVTTAAPVAEEPAPQDQAMVEEAQADPAAEELPPAVEADEAADELQAEIDDLATELDDIESKVEALAERTDAAKAKAQADKKAVESAKDKLDSLS